MKSIRCWDDLSAYGTVPLTGEARGLSYRILCDMTVRGKKTLEKGLGGYRTGAPGIPLESDVGPARFHNPTRTIHPNSCFCVRLSRPGPISQLAHHPHEGLESTDRNSRFHRDLLGLVRPLCR